MHLRVYCETKGLSQRAFGQLMEPPVSQAKVSHWLQGARRVSLAEALQIRRITGGEVSLDELASLSGQGEEVGHAA